MANASSFGLGGLIGQPIPVDAAFTCVWVYGEIADLKCSEILEKMAALRRGDAKITEAGFDDHTRAGNFIPLDRNTKPRIVRSPAADADQQIRTILGV